jgi:hypothetical protein
VKGKKMKYFIQLWDLIEIEVDKEKFIKTEELCGFFPKIEGETATGGFGFDKQGMSIKGRIEKELNEK